MLIVLSGLPGVGETTIAQELARSLVTVHLRIGSIEQALRRAGLVVKADDGRRLRESMAAYAHEWRAVGEQMAVPVVEIIEVVCNVPTPIHGSPR